MNVPHHTHEMFTFRAFVNDAYSKCVKCGLAQNQSEIQDPCSTSTN